MRTISCKLEDLKTMTLHIGYEGENDYTSVRIDAGSVFAQYPEAVPSLKVQPPKGNMYPVIVTRDGDIVIWNVSDSDTASNGNGEIQLTFTENTVVVKSCTGKTLVHRSLKATGPAPDPLIDFIDMAEEVVGEAQDAAEAAEAAAQHAPMIGLDGYWYKWDAETEGYVKTDTKARGEDGANGVGITSVEKISTVGLVDTYRINFTNGTNTTYTVTNGQDGSVPIDDTTPAANKVFSSAKVDEELTDVKNAIDGIEDDLILDVNAIALWEKGSIGLSDGANAANNTRIRTKGYIPKTIKKISVKSGYRYVVCGYSNGVYQGQWTGSGFSKTTLQTRTADTIVKNVGNYDLRVFFENTSGTNIDTSVYNNIIFTGIFDETFSVAGAYAEAKKVGDELQGIENEIANIAIAGRLFGGSVCWRYGGLNSSGSYTINKGRVQTLPITIEQGEQITVECVANTVAFGVYTYNRSDGSFNAISKIIDTKAFTGTDATLKYVILARTNPDTSTITNKEDVTNNIRITVKSKIANIINMIEKYIQYKSILTGKRWAVCGDSFSHGDFTGYPVPANGKIKDGLYKDRNAVYAYFIGNRTGMSIDMVASNGQTLASVESYGNCFVEKLVSAGNYGLISSDTDYITLWFGINDKIQSVPVGDTDSSDVSTFCGAWNNVLTYLRNYHPFAHVGIVVSNSSGSEALPYAEATKAMAKKYGYPYLDLMYDDTLPLLLFEGGRSDVSSSIRSLVHEQMAVNPPSNMHPNEKAHELESYFIEDWLKRI